MYLLGKNYVKVSTATANIVDSFVAPANKMGTGSGEARLYVSSQNSVEYGSFFTFDRSINIGGYIGVKGHCFFTKENLTKYMEDIKVFYDFPIAKYRKDVSLLYDDRLKSVQQLNDINTFQVYLQNGDMDSDRFYIGSNSHLWELMRNICLPSIRRPEQPLTEVHIHKLVNHEDDDVLYYFELFVSPKSNSRHITSNNYSTTVIKKEIENDTTISETERKTIIKARLGQGRFRENTLNIMPTCPFTGINVKSLLRASHIMPWAHCQTNHQRLDGNNGMSLTPTYDLLFDKGLISFENSGELLVSSVLSEIIVKGLNLQKGKIYDIANSSNKKNIYLEYHRKHIFIK